MEQKPLVEVVGAVIRNADGDILCALRSGAMAHPYTWEFPGGKIQPGETPQASLVREIQEELGCRIEVGALVADVSHAYERVIVRLLTYESILLSGEPVAREHLRLLWLPVAALHSLGWAPADIPTVERLQSQK